MSLSIITVTYNNLKGLKKTYASVLEQPNSSYLEWIVVDGASTDGTKDFLSSLPPSDRIRWISEPDGGIYQAMNKGIAMAKGDLLLFLNAGDYFVGSVLSPAPQQACMLPVRVTNYWGRQVKCKVRDHRYALPICHQGIVFPHNKLYYNTKYKIAADYEYYLKNGLGNTYSFMNCNGYIHYESGGLSETNYCLGNQERHQIIMEYFGGYFYMKAVVLDFFKNILKRILAFSKPSKR